MAYIHSESQPEGWLIALVEIPGFEPGQTEPKSVVLPLHHISIPGCKDITIFNLLQLFDNTTFEQMAAHVVRKILETFQQESDRHSIIIRTPDSIQEIW